jgi:hypothetical protein
MQCSIVDGMSLHIRECGFAILIRERRDEGREILRRLLLDRLLLRVACVRVRSG